MDWVKVSLNRQLNNMDFRAPLIPFPQKKHKTLIQASFILNITQKNRAPSPIPNKVNQHNLCQNLKLPCRKEISIQVLYI